MPSADTCLFCQIVAGEIPAEIVRATDDTVAFRDIAPQAPAHLLVIPREHYVDIAQLAASNSPLAGRLVRGRGGCCVRAGVRGVSVGAQHW